MSVYTDQTAPSVYQTCLPEFLGLLHTGSFSVIVKNYRKRAVEELHLRGEHSIQKPHKNKLLEWLVIKIPLKAYFPEELSSSR